MPAGIGGHSPADTETDNENDKTPLDCWGLLIDAPTPRFAKWEVVIIDELGYLPISEAAAELLFQALSERHEFGSVIINSNLPFGEWAQIFKSERLAVALLDRITHRAHVIEMNGDSYRLASARKANRKTKAAKVP